MSFCSTCGAALYDGAAVCVNCGCAVQTSCAPVGQIKTNRGLLKFILLSFVTLGIYPIVVMSTLSRDINIIASRYDGKNTMHFIALAMLVTPVTLGIAPFVWYHRISNRIGGELKRRGIAYNFSCADFWLWNILGSLIIVGPFVYMHKFFKAMNYISMDYNERG